ncbi:MAG: glutamine-hydrolyzing GMP synthase [Candidatus Ranarchaeia archaeon]
MITDIVPIHLTEEKISKFLDDKINEIKTEVKSAKVISAISGGVDSSVATLIAHKALGNQLKSIYIDTGLMRLGERKNVEKIFKGLGIKVKIFNGKEEIFSALKGLTDPEEKRKAFRNAFYTIFQEEVKKLNAEYLVQGTIYPDIIESTRIKTQHNVLDQIGVEAKTHFGFKVIEPLKQLYKNQVRMLAKSLTLPPYISERQPFPGPGFCVRIIGEVTPEKAEIVKKANDIVEKNLEKYNPSQFFAVLLQSKVTGVKGDDRVHGHTLAVRAIKTQDFMTAEIVEVPWHELKKISDDITREIPSIVKVLYDITSKPPSTIEYE